MVALITFDGTIDADETIGKFTVAINTCDLPVIINLLQESLLHVPHASNN
jgi:hypothetical protein